MNIYTCFKRPKTLETVHLMTISEISILADNYSEMNGKKKMAISIS